MIRITLLMAWLLSTANLCHGEIYRWVDDQGKLHFSDKKPQSDHPTEDISKQLRPLNSDTSASETEKLKQVFQEESAEEKAYHHQQQSQQQQHDNARQQACLEAKNQLSILRGRVAFHNPNGKEVIVTEDERARRANQLEEEIRRHCS